MKTSYNSKSIIATFFIILWQTLLAFSQTTAGPNNPVKNESFFSFEPETALFFIALTLGVVIILFIRLLKSAMRFHFDTKKSNETMKFFLIGILLSLSFQFGEAQATFPTARSSQVFLLSPIGWFMVLVIVVEIYTLLLLTKWFKQFTGIANYELGLEKKKINWWDKINAFKPLDKEATIDTGHNYDGIRELNNITPPWFTITFIGTIIFGAAYLYRYHVAYSAPSQIQEYEIALKESEAKKLEYLKTQKNVIDENSVVLLKEGEYEEGKVIFKTACAVCHGDKGQGLVGPNMTDDYWIHGGSVKDIFSTIKYGVLEKGMKSWKDDYSPNQIAQLTSFIKSLRGTSPPNPKAAQGDLYKEVLTPVIQDSVITKKSIPKSNK